MGFVCGGVLATAVSQDVEVEVGVVVVRRRMRCRVVEREWLVPFLSHFDACD